MERTTEINTTPNTPLIKLKRFVEAIIFNVRWSLNIFYFGLIAVLVLYTFAYMKEIVEMVHSAGKLTTSSMMLSILEMVDVVMIANLVKMIISGSYNSFVSKKHGFQNENISSGMLKVKMGTSIIGVSSIHLLQSFVGAEQVDWNLLNKQIAIHVVFLLGALVLALIEYIHVKTEVMEEGMHSNKSAEALKANTEHT